MRARLPTPPDLRYPADISENCVKRTDYCGRIDRRYLGQTVTLTGWVHRRRDHGGVIFIDLRDREGLVQIVCDPDRAATFATAETLRNEFCIARDGSRAAASRRHGQPEPRLGRDRGARARRSRS